MFLIVFCLTPQPSSGYSPGQRSWESWPEAVRAPARGRGNPGPRPCESWPEAVRGVSFLAQTRQNLKLASWPEAVCGARSCLLEFANHVASTLLRLRNNSASRRDMYLGASRASMLKSCGVGMRPMTVWVATSESSGFPPMTVWVSASRSTTAPRIGLNLIGKGGANSGGIGEL